MSNHTRGEKLFAVGAVGFGIWGASNFVQNNFERDDFIPRTAGAFSTDMVQDVAGFFGKEFKLVDTPEGPNVNIDVNSLPAYESSPSGKATMALTTDLMLLPEAR